MATWLDRLGGYVADRYSPCENGRGKWEKHDGQDEAKQPNTWDRRWRENDDVLRWAIAMTNRNPDWAKKYVKEILPSDKVTVEPRQCSAINYVY